MGGAVPREKSWNRRAERAVGPAMRQAKSANSAGITIVSLRWNGEVVATQAVRSGEVVLGDARGSLAPVPEAALGGASLVVADAEGGPHVRVPADRVAKVTGASDGVRLVAGPARVGLAAGEEASLVLGAFEVVVAAHVEEPMKRRRKLAAGAWAHTAVVASIHAALLFAGSRSALAGSIEAEETADLDRLRGYLAAAEDRSSARDVVVAGNEGKGDSQKWTGLAGNGKRGGGERHEGDAGKAGSPNSRATNARWGIEGQRAKGDAAPGDAESADRRAAAPPSGVEVDSLEAAREFGMAGLLRAANSAAQPNAGASPWGSDDAFSAMGGMLGRSLGESEGTSGLSLSGIGEGGGGLGEGIGLGRIGTIGHTGGLPGVGTGGTGTSPGIGLGAIWTGSWDNLSRAPRSPTVRWSGWRCACGVSGRLPPEAVRRIVRQNFGRFRACYQDGLKRNPALTGRVSTSFVIGRDGAVSSVGDAGSDLPDAGVQACVRRAFYGLSFPQPEGGIVTVTYPIVFNPIE